MREQWRPEVLASESGGLGVLDDVVSALGLDAHDSRRLDFQLEGQRVRLEVLFADRRRESPDGLRMTVLFEGPVARRGGHEGDGPTIALRREQAQDRRAKERGVVQEVQTGFAGFDRAVFVLNRATDEDAQRVLAKEATRQGVLRLLEDGHAVVRITRTGVSVEQGLVSGRAHAASVLLALEDLLIVARAGGPKSPEPQRRGAPLQGVALGAALVSVLYAGVVLSRWQLAESAHLLLVAVLGVVVGGLAALFSWRAVERSSAGDSASGPRAASTLVLFALSAAAFSGGAVIHLNGALDGGEGEVWRGVVEGVADGAADFRRRSTTRPGRLGRSLTVRWRDGSTSSFRWPGLATEGARCSERRFEGALGLGWVTEREVY